jgi:IS5 family transposase
MHFQFFCGEEFFQHRLPFDRSSLTRWRQRMGDAKLTALIQESLSVATRTEAMKPKDLAHVAQDQRQRGSKVYSLHAPEVECIGKGNAHRPDEFGIKVSVATTAHRSKGGQFVTHIAALPGNPYDGHTLATVIPAMEE